MNQFLSTQTGLTTHIVLLFPVKSSLSPRMNLILPNYLSGKLVRSLLKNCLF
ncbi:hypothetical protein [Chlorogloeopsis sp. ULAP02]|uniref:hypothetical protein n=1 Tax=Chlorogloeopsis sp. ULAP02 TaxID=3107926 RepID=UPI00398B58CA